MTPPFRGEGLVRAALRLLPAALRRDHGEEMIDGWRADAGRLPRGAGHRARFWGAIAADIARAAVRARRPTRPGGGPSAATRATTAAPSSLFTSGADVRLAWRSLRRAPGMTVLVVATLALGIGLTTAISGLVHGVLFAPLPYRDADRLVYIQSRREKDDVRDATFAARVFRQIQDEVGSLEAAVAYDTIRQNLTGAGQAEQIEVGWVSRNFFEVLGTVPAMGRLLRPDDPPGTAILSHDAWLRFFDGRADVLGRGFELDGHGYTVVGVLPADFHFEAPTVPERVDVWKAPDAWWQNGDVWGTADRTVLFLRVVGRLAPSATGAQLTDELDALMARVRDEEPELAGAGYAASAVPLLDAVTRRSRTPLLLLLAAVGCVLLIACANVMGLLLVRAQGREREVAVRVALGSGRWRIVRQLLAEALLLAIVGGTAGVALAWLAVPAIRSASLPGLPRLDTVSVDLTTLAVAAAATIGCTILATLAPAVWALRLRVGGSLTTARSGPGRARQRTSRILVVVQVALSLVLVIGATLLAASLAKTARVDPGFDPAPLATFAVSLPGSTYTWPEGTNRFLREFETRLAALPGVESAAVIWPLPLGGSRWSTAYGAGSVRIADRVLARLHLVTPDYFETLRVPLVAGRSFGTDDPKRVLVVSRALAERAWPDGDAVGRTLRTNPWGGERDFEVIGVAENVRYRGLQQPAEEVIYLDAAGWSWADWEVDVVVRTAGAPLDVVPAARAALASIDPSIPLARPRAMRAVVDDQLAAGRLAVAVAGLFALSAATLTVVGLYGVISQLVLLRLREIGIRVALGSGRAAIRRWVLGQGLRLGAAGVVLGLGGALWLGALLRAYLYEVEPADPAILAGAAIALLVLAGVAALAPAVRATRVEPIRILRGE